MINPIQKCTQDDRTYLLLRDAYATSVNGLYGMVGGYIADAVLINGNETDEELLELLQDDTDTTHELFWENEEDLDPDHINWDEFEVIDLR